MFGAKNTTRSLACNREAEGREGRRYGTDGSHRHPSKLRPRARAPPLHDNEARQDSLQCIHFGLMSRFRGCDRKAVRGSQLFGHREIVVKEVAVQFQSFWRLSFTCSSVDNIKNGLRLLKRRGLLGSPSVQSSAGGVGWLAFRSFRLMMRKW
jgi:hypothetical protein